MEMYIGTKIINAEPMTRGEYAIFSGRNSILTEKGETESDKGYKVTYEDGYVSWSPEKAFLEAYRKSGEMNFGHALEMLKHGKRVARKGWNGKGMYLYLADGKLLTEAIGDGSFPFTDTIVMKTADDKYVIGWLASQTDMLAEDWELIN